MKITAIWLAIFVIFGYLKMGEAADLADVSEAQKAAFEACVLEKNLTPDEIKLVQEPKGTIKTSTTEVSQRVQCFSLCFYKKLGLITSEGKYNTTVITKFLQQMIKDETKVKGALVKCSSLKGDNPCQIMYNFEQCIMQQV